jgi:hypothetical protein
MKPRLGENKEATMINLSERPAKIGEIACFQDTKTGDYSLSLHGAIAELTAENERLQVMLDDLLNAFGSA